MKLWIEKELIDRVTFCLGVGYGFARAYAKEPETIELMRRISDDWIDSVSNATRTGS